MSGLFLDSWAEAVAADEAALHFHDFTREGSTVDRQSFAEVDRRARVLAAGLDVEPGTGVIVAVDEQSEFVHALLACFLRGAVAIPMPAPASGARAAERFAQVVAGNPGIRVIGSRRGLPDPGVFGSGSGGIRVDYIEDLRQSPDNVAAGFTDPLVGSPSGRARPDDVCIVQFTSGSTSAPKGVPITQRALLANLGSLGSTLRTTQTDVGVSWIPFHHDMGLIGTLLHPLRGGFDMHYLSASSFIRRPARWLDLVGEHSGSMIVAPDFGYRLCIDRVPADWIGDLSSLRIAIDGSEPINADTLRAFERRFAGHGFDGAAWMPSYGMAEATLIVSGRPRMTGARATRFDATELDLHDRAVPAARPGESAQPGEAGPSTRELVGVGAPVGSEVRIERDGDEVAAGEVGEVLVRGASMFGGEYLTSVTRLEPTRDQTGKQPEAPGWHRTGDMGFVYDDELYICGRRADMISRNGVNHHAVDIERKLTEVAGAPLPSAAFGVDVGDLDDAMLVVEVPRAVAVRSPEILDGLDDWAHALATAVGLPRIGLGVVTLGTLPRTTSGKVQRALIRAGFLAGEIDFLACNAVARSLGAPAPASPTTRS